MTPLNAIKNYRLNHSEDTEYREYMSLYDWTDSEDLKIILSTLQHEFLSNFELMNQRLPTGDYTAHFWADPSRNLLNAIAKSDKVLGMLSNSEFAIKIVDAYVPIVEKCKNFLVSSGGSEIPENMSKIFIDKVDPFFEKVNNFIVPRNEHASVNVKLIGEGSYAKVLKYHDAFYNHEFALKRGLSDLTDKECRRFKREFEILNELSHPNIVDVYRFDDRKCEYTMEFCDLTIEKYIKLNNQKLSQSKRLKLVREICSAFQYIHNKNLLHRDIALNNVLIKSFENDVVAKVSDFGLVKQKDSDLTSQNTEFKGSLNDPSLQVVGFVKYSMPHEIFALTRLLYFIMTGKTVLDKSKYPEMSEFLTVGTNSDINARPKNVTELYNILLKCSKGAKQNDRTR
ncbi:MAG: protein kinase [Candidatus Ancillula sp.]|jgi:serine/threonine-protein kinase|nr:protein kinase [Candidatus Ancillula sp.]